MSSGPRSIAWAFSILLLALWSLIPSQSALARPIGPDARDPFLADDEDADSPPPPRTQVLAYHVREGDALWTIAAYYGLDVDTLRWSNPALAANPDYLRPGLELVILPVKGAYVTVQPGDTVERLATRWGVAPDDIRNFALNDLRPGDQPQPGARLVIPHGRREVKLAPPGPAAGYTYAWPIRGGITQPYSAAHRAVDLGAPYGAQVYAARTGRVTAARWSDVGYGYLVIVDHGDGSQALYSHLKGAWVKVGDRVGRGDLIGEVGSTGNSTGPHIHFEIRIGGAPQNPLSHLPPEP
jgi:murein DD-endopeptidase MepM/ murein hydrolase activator NlpD